MASDNLKLQAITLTEEICRNIDLAAKLVEKIDYTVVLRGDSTLRGHFPEARILNPVMQSNEQYEDF